MVKHSIALEKIKDKEKLRKALDKIPKTYNHILESTKYEMKTLSKQRLPVKILHISVATQNTYGIQSCLRLRIWRLGRSCRQSVKTMG